jgi:hypothetical protein
VIGADEAVVLAEGLATVLAGPSRLISRYRWRHPGDAGVPDGQITIFLSSPPGKNIPVFVRPKSLHL